MKILAANPDGGAFYYIINGYIKAFEAHGHIAKRWNGNLKELREFKPDLYFGSSGWIQDLPLERDFCVCLHVNPYGDKIGSISSGPIIDESEQIIQKVAKIKPDRVWGYFSEPQRKYWKNWENILNIPALPLPTAADHFLFKQTSTIKQYDIGFIGGRWPYKSINIDKYLLPALKKFKYKIAGWGGWPDNISSGTTTDPEVVELLSESLIAPCICEPHTTIYGIDVPERIFKVSLCGALAISDIFKDIEYLFPNNMIPIADTPEKYSELIKYYLDHSEEREELVKKQREYILNTHTYVHRTYEILKSIGYNYRDPLEIINGIKSQEV